MDDDDDDDDEMNPKIMIGQTFSLLMGFHCKRVHLSFSLQRGTMGFHCKRLYLSFFFLLLENDLKSTLENNGLVKIVAIFYQLQFLEIVVVCSTRGGS